MSSAVLAVLLLAASLSSCVQLARPAAPRASASKPRRSKISPKQLTHLLSSADDAHHLLRAYSRHNASVAPIHVGAFWSRLGKLVRGADPGAAQFLDEHERWLDGPRARTLSVCADGECDARTLATIAHGMAHAGVSVPQPTWGALATAAEAQIEAFSTMELANTAWSFSKANVAAPALFDALACESLARIEDFRPVELANTAWAFSRAGGDEPELFDAVAEEAARRAAELKPFELSSIACAFARAGQPAPDLFAALATEAQAPGRLAEWNSQALVNLAWAFAKAGAPAPALFDAVAAEVRRRRASALNAQELSSTAWAFARASHKAPKLFDEIAAEAEARASELSSQGLANIAWAFATAQHEAPSLFDAIAAESTRERLDESFRPQELANLAWAFATCGHAAPALFERLVVVVQSRLDELNTQDICSVAWAFSSARRAAPELYADHFGFRLLQAPYWDWDAAGERERECKDNDEECEPAAQPAALLRRRKAAMREALDAMLAKGFASEGQALRNAGFNVEEEIDREDDPSWHDDAKLAATQAAAAAAVAWAVTRGETRVAEADLRPPDARRAGPPQMQLREARPPPLMQLVDASFDGCGDDCSVLTEPNVLAALDDFEEAAASMFGRHAEAAAIGITGRMELRGIDGPIVLLGLVGRFWHKRATVLYNAEAFLRSRIPEIAEVDVADIDDLVDVIRDEDTGEVLVDKRAPDVSGDRATMEYQGIDPDTRGPFASPSGGFRAGGSIFS